MGLGKINLAKTLAVHGNWATGFDQLNNFIDLIVTDKPYHQLPHRVIEPPDVQCSNLLAMKQNISYYWEYICYY